MNDRRVPVLERTVLNPVQKEAVAYIDGPQLVFAGAGTGKTRVLTAKIAYLIDHGLYPGQIFAATFTNKAAREMRERVENLIGMPAGNLWIGTFHSLCVRILRREAGHIGYMTNFSIYDDADQLSLLKKVFKNFEIDDRTMAPRTVLSVISHHKSKCVTAEELEAKVSGFYDRELVRIYKEYQKRLKEQHAMDFDDLLANTVYLFRNNPAILERYQGQFKYVLVDEYQDTNLAQFYFVKLLSQKHRHIFAVGDDDQSIYGWRGAQIDNILGFEREFPNTRVFKLEQNYRSTRAILDFANAAIAGNTHRAAKKLWTDRSGGNPVVVTHYRDDRQEADSVAEKVEALLKKNVKGGDMAVLFRTNAQSRNFEESFRKHRIQYILVGGTGFYERKEIKDCLAYLRLVVNPYDNASFERIVNIPARGLGEKAMESLAALAGDRGESLLQTVLSGAAAQLGSRSQKGFNDLKELFTYLSDLYKQKIRPHEIIDSLLQLSGYVDMLSSEDSEEAEGRIENINELINAVTIWSEENSEKDLPDFLEEVSLATDVDTWDRRENAVNLMTLHCAKGLEFRVVFLVGLEDGIIPSRQNFDDNSKIEEERRLLYVGSTRAMEVLECSHVDQRWRFGDLLPSIPSRFFDSIPPDLYTFFNSSGYFGQVQSAADLMESKYFRGNGARSPVTHPSAVRPEKVVRQVPEYDEFNQNTVEYRMGQQVVHKVYGRGKILSISGFGDDMKMTVLFNDGTRRKLMAKFANFENP